MAEAGKLITKPKVKIKVFGVGGGGNNVLIRMAEDNTLDIDLVAVNTDQRKLQQVASVSEDIQLVPIGEQLTRGRGTGGNVALAERAARQEEARLREVIKGADLIFITAGMGGGVGTGAAPVLASIAKKMGVLSIGVVTMPFSFEGRRKQKTAQLGMAALQQEMDALIAVQNDNIKQLPENRSMTLMDAFKAADSVLRQSITCVAQLILTTGVINVDFADVTAILRQSTSSDALLSIGRSKRGALDALQNAISSPLVDKDVTAARGFILNLAGDESLTLWDVDAATSYIYEHTDPSVNIILGTVIDPALKGEIQVTIIATDFVDCVMPQTAPAQDVAAPASQTAGQSAAPAQTGAVAAGTAQAGANAAGAAPAAQQPQPASQVELEAPSFMRHPQPAQPSTGAFAIPAFKLTPDHDEQK